MLKISKYMTHGWLENSNPIWLWYKTSTGPSPWAQFTKVKQKSRQRCSPNTIKSCSRTLDGLCCIRFSEPILSHWLIPSMPWQRCLYHSLILILRCCRIPLIVSQLQKRQRNLYTGLLLWNLSLENKHQTIQQELVNQLIKLQCFKSLQ